MNLKLKLAIREYLDEGKDFKCVIGLKTIGEIFNMHDMVFNPIMEEPYGFEWSEEEGMYNITIKSLWENDIFRYLELSDKLVLEFKKESYVKPMLDTVKDEFLEKWYYSTDLGRVVISHLNCNDGHGVIEVVKYINNHKVVQNAVPAEIENIMVDYNTYDFETLVKQVTGKIVYVGDFSFNKIQFDRLMEVTDSIVIVDHHLGAFNSDVAGYDNVHIDMSISGALLAWEFFIGKDDIPPYIITLIGDRDVWNFFYGTHTKAMQLMFQKEGLKCIEQYMSLDDEISYTKLVDDLTPYMDDIDKVEDKYKKRALTARKYNINGNTLYGLNLTSSVSDILNHVSKHFGTPSFAYWEDENGLLQFSFRNYRDDISVEDIAKVYGGGGHLQASGCKFNFTDINLESFFINKKLSARYKIVDDKTELFFHKAGVSCNGYVTTENCEHAITTLAFPTIINPTFLELFIVTKDDDNNLILSLRI